MTLTTKQPQARRGNPPTHILYFIPDREGAPWTRIGAAWPTRGEGFRIAQDLTPCGGGTIILWPAETATPEA
jgi:hypothetical protein